MLSYSILCSDMILDPDLRKVNHNKSIESRVNCKNVVGKEMTAFVRLMKCRMINYFLSMLDIAQQVDVELHTCNVD